MNLGLARAAFAQVSRLATCSSVNLEQQVLRNSGLIFVARVVSIAVSICTVPLIIKHLGIQGYGTWESLLAISTLATIFQSSLGGALLWGMSAALGRNRPHELNRLAGAGLIVTVLLIALILPPAWFFRSATIAFLHIPVAQVVVARAIMPALLGMATLSCIHETMASILGAHQHIGVAILLQAVLQALDNTAALILVAAGFGLTSMLLGHAATFLIGLGLYAAAIKMLCKAGTLSPAFPTMSDLHQTVRYGALMLTATIAVAMRGQSDKVILAAVGSQSLVATYSIAAKLASLVIITSSILTTPLITAVGRLVPADHWEKIKSLYSNVTSLVCLASGLAAVVLAAVHQQLLTLWLGAHAPHIASILYMLLFGNLFVVVASGTASALCKGLNRLGIETHYAAISLVLNVVFTPILLLLCGPVGTVIASVLTWCVSSLLFLVSVLRKLRLGSIAVRTGALAIVFALGTLGILQVLGFPLRQALDRGGQPILTVAGTAVIGGLLYTAAMWFSCEDLRSAIRRMLWPAVDEVAVS
jgi:O-antigen/teichoic acid export membrane protein